MGADETYQFLKEHEGFYSAKKLSEELGVNIKSISRSLNVLVRDDDIVCEQIKLTAVHSNIHKTQLTRLSWVYTYVKNKGDDKIGR